YGRAAEAALKASGMYEAVKGKLVLGENVEQTAQFAQTKAADVALIPMSLAMASPLKEAGRVVRVPVDVYPPIEDGVVVTAWARDPEDARAFCDFVVSPAGREVLGRFGLSPPASPAPER